LFAEALLHDPHPIRHPEAGADDPNATFAGSVSQKVTIP
jgi:hypothetical protein